MRLNPYLHFNGDCEAAFKFYSTTLGGKIIALMPYAGSPAAANTPPDWLHKIMHARIDIAGNILMGSDAPPGRFQPPQGFSVTLNIGDPAEAGRAYAALADGGAQRLGFLEGQFKVPDDFDTMFQEEIIAMSEGDGKKFV
jgi:PhnB protein